VCVPCAVVPREAARPQRAGVTSSTAVDLMYGQAGVVCLTAHAPHSTLGRGSPSGQIFP
jgi:hypothetical protein